MNSGTPRTVPPNRRRDKVQLSCNLCRQKKLRCDRQKPCQACVARGAGPSCTFPTKAIFQPSASSSRSSSTSQSRLMKRLDSLEESLNSLVHAAGNGGPRQPVTSTAHTPASSESGSMHCSPKGTVYAGSAHWTSIFDSISGLRDCIGRDGGDSESSDQPKVHPEPLPSGGPHLLSGHNTTATKSELLSAMPERLVVDRHVFRYFNRHPLIFIHAPSFLRQYEAFWSNSPDTPVLWLSLLYSIICLTPLDHAASAAIPGDTQPSQWGVYQPPYLEQVIQCLIIGDYSRGGPHAIEALYHYFMLEHSRRRDPDTRNWSLCGLILRLALRKGYHREPSRYPTITPFEGELRRRLWTMLYYMDVALSTQMGLPRLIKDEQCDTGSPSNLLDTDFDEDIKELPSPRPDKEITPVLSWIVKYNIMRIIAKISDLSLTTADNEDDPCSSPRVNRLDTLLRTTYDQLPKAMKFTSLVNCLGSSAEDIMHKLIVSILLQKGLIILHRRHVVGGKPPGTKYKCGETCAASVCACIDAALQMLEYQDLVYYESQAGGALAALGWRLLSAPISHEFLMATSVLCSYLYRVCRGDADVVGASTENIQAVEKALARTYRIWRSQTNGSKDAQRATDTLGLLLGRFRGYDGRGEAGYGVDGLVDGRGDGLMLGDAGGLLYDGFGLYGDGMNDFSSFMTW